MSIVRRINILGMAAAAALLCVRSASAGGASHETPALENAQPQLASNQAGFDAQHVTVFPTPRPFPEGILYIADNLSEKLDANGSLPRHPISEILPTGSWNLVFLGTADCPHCVTARYGEAAFAKEGVAGVKVSFLSVHQTAVNRMNDLAFRDYERNALRASGIDSPAYTVVGSKTLAAKLGFEEYPVAMLIDPAGKVEAVVGSVDWGTIAALNWVKSMTKRLPGQALSLK